MYVTVWRSPRAFPFKKSTHSRTSIAFPTLWHYDVLRALDYLRAAGVTPDTRMAEAAAIVLDRRHTSGRWLLDVRHRKTLYEEFSGAVGQANRWITFRARRVLDWFGRRNVRS